MISILLASSPSTSFLTVARSDGIDFSLKILCISMLTHRSITAQPGWPRQLQACTDGQQVGLLGLFSGWNRFHPLLVKMSKACICIPIMYLLAILRANTKGKALVMVKNKVIIIV